MRRFIMVLKWLPSAALRRFGSRHVTGLTASVLLVIYMYHSISSHQTITSYKKELQQSPIGGNNIEEQSLIVFQEIPPSGDLNDSSFDNVHLFPCTQPNGPDNPGGIVDLMCVPRPNYLPSFKNPCYRDAKDKLRCLPYFNLLGFDKCGTTDLHNRLTLHPSIFKCNAYMGKEIYFWTWRRLGIFQYKNIKVLTLDKYTLIFKNATANISANEGKEIQPIVGDGSPVDGWEFRGWPLDPQNKGLSEPKVLAPHVMRHIVKDPRLIFIMREPADRLYSDYHFTKRAGTPEKFDSDVAKAIKMMNDCLKVNSTRVCFFSNYLYNHMPTRLHIGCYSIFLREWLSVFHRKHFLFLRTEDFNKDVRGTLETVFKFLQVESVPESKMEEILNAKRKFETERKALAGPMFESTKKVLKDFYAPCNADLRKLLGEDKFLWSDV